MRFAYFAVLSLLASLPCKAVSSREEDDIAMKSRHLKPKKETGGTKKAKGNKGKEKGVNEKAKENKGKEVKVEKGIKGKKKTSSPSREPSQLPSASPSEFPSMVPSANPSYSDPQREALDAIYVSTNGSGWTGDYYDQNNWGSLATIPDFDVCALTGVFDCSEDGKITLLDLAFFGLDGPIPSEIGLLTSLTFLNLYSNALTGQIPSEIGLLTNLEYLALNSNALTGTLPLAFENLTFAPYLCYLDRQQVTDTDFVGVPLVDFYGVKGNCEL